tara:strand:+ start:1386 stop:3221 length:1836 start_codon:yes stop_codon:yes gene_type:complete
MGAPRYYFRNNDKTIFDRFKNKFIRILFNDYYRNQNVFLNLFLSKKIVSKLIGKTFELRNAPLADDTNYIKINNKKLFEIEYSDYTSPCYIVHSSEKIYSEIKVNDDNSLLLGLGILDDKLSLDENYDIVFYFSINSSLNRKFTVPINRGKILNRSVGSYFRGIEFIDLQFDLSKYQNQEILLKIDYDLLYNGAKVAFGQKIVPKIAIKAPQLLLNRRKDLKKIVLLSCESLTDPFWLEKKHKIDLDLKGLNALSFDGLRYDNSFAQQDGTLPFMSTMQTGLYSSQHKLGDYARPIYDAELNEKYLTLAKILKNNNFITEAYTPQGRWDTSYGWARGFDLFKVTKEAWDIGAPASGNINRSLQRFKNYNTFSFFHIDRVHQPMLEFVKSQSPNLYSIDMLNAAEEGNWYPALFHQIKALDKIIHSIIETLKYESIYDETLIILTGDHGVSIPPNWKPGSDYALYDEHIRVPTIIKWPKWCSGDTGINSSPYNASTSIYKVVLESLGLDYPVYFNDLPQQDSQFNNIAFSETIYHPRHNNYSLGVLSEKYKYVTDYEIDWKTSSLTNIKKKLLKKNGCEYDDNNNLLNNMKVPEKLDKITKLFLEKNIKFKI